MCRRVIEKYSACKCDYYIHDIEKCEAVYVPGHVVEDKVVFVGYCCSKHMPPPTNLNAPEFIKPNFDMTSSLGVGAGNDALGAGMPKSQHERQHEFRLVSGEIRPRIKAPKSGVAPPKKAGISMQASWPPDSKLQTEDHRTVRRVQKRIFRDLSAKDLRSAAAEEPEPKVRQESPAANINTSSPIFNNTIDTPGESVTENDRNLLRRPPVVSSLGHPHDYRREAIDSHAFNFNGEEIQEGKVQKSFLDLNIGDIDLSIFDDDEYTHLPDEYVDMRWVSPEVKEIFGSRSSSGLRNQGFPEESPAFAGFPDHKTRSSTEHSENNIQGNTYSLPAISNDNATGTTEIVAEIQFNNGNREYTAFDAGYHLGARGIEEYPQNPLTLNGDPEPEPRIHLCPKDGCPKSIPGNGFIRETDLRRHVKKMHEDTETKGRPAAEPEARKEPAGLMGNFPNIVHQELSDFAKDNETPIENKPRSFSISEPAPDIEKNKTDQTEASLASKTEASILFGNESALKSWHMFEELSHSGLLDNINPTHDPQVAKSPSKGDDKTRQKMFIHLQRYLENAPPSKSSFSLSREALLKKYHKFQQKAAEAFRKLETASLYRSEDFDRFVFQDLRAVENVIDIGQSALCDFIDQKMKKPPDNLTSLYCMLHVCYAMSQASNSNASQITDVQFAKSASEWKHCITADTDPRLRRQKQDLFDELVEVMWDEFKEGLEYAMQFEDVFNAQNDPMFETAGVFDTNDPGFVEWNPPGEELDWNSFVNIDDTSSESVFDLSAFTPFESVSGTSHSISPPESHSSPPPWEALVANTFITAALTFVEELKETGIVFLYLCGSIAVSTLRYFTKSSTPTTEPVKPSSNERQDILNALTPSSANGLNPIIKMASKPFLTGVIDTFNDLEECMVAFLKVANNDPHSFLCSFTLLTTHFYTYYHQRLPQHLKCGNDGYNSPTYVSERIRGEENNLTPNNNNKIPVNKSKPSAHMMKNFVIQAEAATPIARTRKRKGMSDEEDGLAMKACMKKFRCEGASRPVKAKPTKFVFKIMTGEPTKRKNKQW